MSKWEYTETELWRFGEGDISIYHVFSAVAVGNTVLVFAEARHGDGSDAASAHELYMKKSTDGGRSFGESLSLLPNEEKRCPVNPTPLFDAQTGRLFLAFAENFDNKRTLLYLMHSDDLGESWSTPREITASVTQKSDTRFHVPGPGHGLQIRKGPHTGRLLLQLWHRGEDITLPRTKRGYCASLLCSDDHGETWQHIPPIGHALCANESRLCEANGGLLWTLRSHGTQHAMTRSTDGGITWSEVAPLPLSPANACDAGLISLNAGGKYTETVLISRISNTEKAHRRDMEIQISTDGGQSFTGRFTAPPGDAMPGYSDLCLVGGDEPTVGLVHCRHNHVLFSRISFQALTGGEFEQTARSVWLKI